MSLRRWNRASKSKIEAKAVLEEARLLESNKPRQNVWDYIFEWSVCLGEATSLCCWSWEQLAFVYPCFDLAGPKLIEVRRSQVKRGTVRQLTLLTKCSLTQTKRLSATGPSSGSTKTDKSFRPFQEKISYLDSSIDMRGENCIAAFSFYAICPAGVQYRRVSVDCIY